MEETENKIKFYWDEINETYITTLKLDDNIARIYFSRNFGSVKKENYLGWIWNMGLAIGRKKALNNWYYGLAPSPISNLPTYSKYGIKVMIWAKNVLKAFIEERQSWGMRCAIAIGAEDKRRWCVYQKYLGKIGFKPRTVKYGYNYDFRYEYEGENDFIYYKELVRII